MKLTDHESDPTVALRLNASSAGNNAPIYRESWLDKLARHLGATPVDHVTIPPVSFVPAKACCAAGNVSCSG